MTRIWTVHNSPYANFAISGPSLPEAIEQHFEVIARSAGLGNAAGYRLVDVRAEYRPGILGGKGGVELLITHRGMDLAHRPADPEPQVTTVWIHAAPDDLPTPHEFSLKR